MRLHQTQYNRGCLELDLLRVEAARGHLRQALDGLTALEREGMLQGRTRDRGQLLPYFTAEVAACDAAAALPGDLKALSLLPAPGSYRFLRIHVGLLAGAGRLGDLPAAAEALCAMDARGPDHLYQLGRSLAWCAGRFDSLSATATTADTEIIKNLRQRLADRAVAVLERAAGEGLAHPSRLEIDAFLAPVRDHPGFRKLIESHQTAGSGSSTSASRDGRSATIQTHKP